MNAMILATAIQLNRGEIDWDSATSAAAGDDLHREWCEQACVSEDQVRAAALAGLADGSIESLAGCERLAVRVNFALAVAAEQLVTAEACRLRDAAREVELTAAIAVRDRKLDLCRAIEAALPTCEQSTDGYGGFGSIYYSFRGLTIRVSDHAQVAGGGFNAQTGERNGESEVSFVVADAATALPTRETIRGLVARALRAEREAVA